MRRSASSSASSARPLARPASRVVRARREIALPHRRASGRARRAGRSRARSSAVEDHRAASTRSPGRERGAPSGDESSARSSSASSSSESARSGSPRCEYALQGKSTRRRAIADVADRTRLLDETREIGSIALATWPVAIASRASWISTEDCRDEKLRRAKRSARIVQARPRPRRAPRLIENLAEIGTCVRRLGRRHLLARTRRGRRCIAARLVPTPFGVRLDAEVHLDHGGRPRCAEAPVDLQRLLLVHGILGLAE